MTAILGVAPTTAYRKGEIYKEGRGQQARGRTGVWVLSSDGHVTDTEFNQHLKYLLLILFLEKSQRKIEQLRELMHDAQLRADVTCFCTENPERRLLLFQRVPGPRSLAYRPRSKPSSIRMTEGETRNTLVLPGLGPGIHAKPARRVPPLALGGRLHGIGPRPSMAIVCLA